jgi:class 3 adenylate cyclase
MQTRRETNPGSTRVVTSQDKYGSHIATMTDRHQSREGASAAKPPETPAGERRIITALFCDVVNSTTLAERLDPEDWTDIMNGAFQILNAQVHRYEGTVNKFMGDAILALFGEPIAHEDDPQRAILAGLDIIESIKPYREQVQHDHGLDFNVRVGINTGRVVVGQVGSSQAMEHTAMGDAVNVAARMEQTAAPGTVQISGDTYRLVAPLIDVEPLGDIEVKGRREPVPAYRVIGLKAHPGRLRGVRGVSAPLIGRDAQWAQLKDIIARLQAGQGQVACLVGEAGLGKSRMLSELHKYWVDQKYAGRWDTLTGIPYDASRPYGLFQNFARAIFGVELDDPPPEIHRKIQAYLRGIGAPESQVTLCSVAFERVIAAKVLFEAPTFSAEVIKNDIYDQMKPGFRFNAEKAPTVLVVDDAQWADQASVHLILHLMQLTREVPVLFLCAFRPDGQSPAWTLKRKIETDFGDRYTEITLQPLEAGDANALISALLNIAELPDELRQLILRKADGNPYFVEEIVRTLIEQGIVYETEDRLHWKASTKIADITIPDTLQALLMARIDRLDQEAKSTLQVASVIGRSFYYRILKAISESAIALDKQLGSLQRMELLREAERMPELEYIFKHELARDAAYGSILNRKRRELHQRVAEAIEAMFPDRLEEHAHRLAHHASLAGDYAKAMRFYVMAGEAAAALHANTESAMHYSRAIDAAKQLGVANEEIGRLESKRTALSVD